MLTYFIGRKLGSPFLAQYGKLLFLGPKRLERITYWFERYGNKLLLVSYFIPGLRHFTGYISGTLNIRSRTFFLYTNIGAVLWVFTFVMLGKVLGPKWEQIYHLITTYKKVINFQPKPELCYIINITPRSLNQAI
jgi:membrane protein DedA with SNARE-associated domain